jgi:hypothetical protein
MTDQRPVVSFPPGVVDRDGRRIRLGAHVRGEADGRPFDGEVVAWRGRLGVEVLVVDDEGHPSTTTVTPWALTRDDTPLPDPVTVGWIVVEDDPAPTLLVVPVGTQDVQPPADGDLGPFPDPAGHGLDRNALSRRVAAREWGRACLDALAGLDDDAAAALVARHLRCPMIGRVLDEASLPDTVRRVALVATDQERPHHDDTVWFAELVGLWLRGRGHLLAADADDAPIRLVAELADPVLLRSMPHVTDAVSFALGSRMGALADGCDRIAVVHAGGTPGMTFGALLAAVLHGHRPVRHIQVPGPLRIDGAVIDQPLIELDVAALPEVGTALYGPDDTA